MSPKAKTESPRLKRAKRSHSQHEEHESNTDTPSNPNTNHNNVFAHEAFETWLACGKCAITYGAADVAINSFNSALKYDPTNRMAILGLAAASRSKDVKENSVEWSQKSIQIISGSIQQRPDLGNDSACWKELAECHLITGYPDAAHGALQRALQLNPTDASLWLLDGQALIRLGMIEQSVSSLQQSLNYIASTSENQRQTTSEDIDTMRAAHAELAAIYATEGEIEAATQELQIILSLPPPPPDRVDEHAALWCALATARERAGDLEGAIQACKSACAAVGDYPRVLINLAYLLLLKETHHFNPQEAISLLMKVYHRKTAVEEDFLPAFLLGYAYGMSDCFKEAYDMYQLALKNSPSSPIAWLGVGGLYLHLGQLGDALSAYSQAARLQNDHSPSPQNTSALYKVLELAAAYAWEGLASVYERCDDQAADARDACTRASTCYKNAGDTAASTETLRKAEVLTSASKDGLLYNDSLPFPATLVRDLVPLTQTERVALLKEKPMQRSPPPQQQQLISPPNQQGHFDPTRPEQAAMTAASNQYGAYQRGFVIPAQTPPPQQSSQIVPIPTVQGSPILIHHAYASVPAQQVKQTTAFYQTGQPMAPRQPAFSPQTYHPNQQMQQQQPQHPVAPPPYGYQPYGQPAYPPMGMAPLQQQQQQQQQMPSKTYHLQGEWR